MGFSVNMKKPSRLLSIFFVIIQMLTSMACHPSKPECFFQPGPASQPLPVGKVLGVLLEGLAEFLVRGLDVVGQLAGWVLQGGQAQLLLQALVDTAGGCPWVGRERRVGATGLGRQS